MIEIELKQNKGNILWLINWVDCSIAQKGIITTEI